MNFTDLADDAEDALHSPAERVGMLVANAWHARSDAASPAWHGAKHVPTAP